MSASAVTLIGMGKAAATPTASVSATSGAEAVPVGGATAEAAAGAGVAAEERAGTGSTEEVEVRKFPLTPPPQPITTAQGTRSRSVEAQPCISDADVQRETS